MKTKHMRTLGGMRFYHYVQPEPWGCMYYSYACLTGIEMFEHVEDCNVCRFLGRAWESGNMLYPLYVSHDTPVTKGDPVFWSRTVRDTRDKAPLPLMLTLRNLGENHHHMVACVIYAGHFYVFDPSLAVPMDFDLGEFLDNGYYADAIEVACVQTSYVDAYEPIMGSSLDSKPPRHFI